MVRCGSAGILRTITACALAAGLSMATATAASAFHQYSLGRDNSEGAHYTAVQLERADPELGGYRSGTGCSTYYSGDPGPIYHCMWIVTAQGNWLEIGTADQCNDFDYMYWGYGYGGDWYPQGQATTPGSGDHLFTIKRDEDLRWRWKLDGTVLSGLTWNVIGSRVDAGLESYDGNPVLSPYEYKNLEYKADDGDWTRWRGRDASSVGSDMCGSWIYDARWEAGENTSC